MRLLNVSTLRLETFYISKPPYVILSHTWGDGEVLYEDLSAESAPYKAGWLKIIRCCEFAKERGFTYVWIGTCCIDKRDSSELSEAINSMFKWYEESAVCLAFLEDIKTDCYDDWKACRWFTRGWTLQELLAPKHLLFMSSEWNLLGTKASRAQEIFWCTGISVKQLRDFKSCDIATKMTWAAGRHTTRVEDQAYSLIGLFGLTMPLLYGEGREAFIRLQKELLNRTTDESLFSHGLYSVEADGVTPHDYRIGGTGRYEPLFARTASEFNAGHQTIFDADRPETSMTNKGLMMWPILYAMNLSNQPMSGDNNPFDEDTFEGLEDNHWILPLNYGPQDGGYYALHLEAAHYGGRNMFKKSSMTIVYTRDLRRLRRLEREKIYVVPDPIRQVKSHIWWRFPAFPVQIQLAVDSSLISITPGSIIDVRDFILVRALEMNTIYKPKKGAFDNGTNIIIDYGYKKGLLVPLVVQTPDDTLNLTVAIDRMHTYPRLFHSQHLRNVRGGDELDNPLLDTSRVITKSFEVRVELFPSMVAQPDDESILVHVLVIYARKRPKNSSGPELRAGEARFE